MEKMLVTTALNELKLLDSRIFSAIGSTKFVSCAKTSESKVTPNKTKEEFKEEAKSNMQSINDLISRREKIKAAVVMSNAKTEIEVCGEKHTVAEVIDMKNSIEYKSALLNRMRGQLSEATATMNNNNQKMESSIDKLIEVTFGKESKTKVNETDIDAIANPYRAKNEYSLVDPIGVEKQIKELSEWIEEFTSTVDAKLQVSNCITYIEF